MAVLKIKESEFDTEVRNSPIPVLVDFYADWCGPCAMLAPVLEELSEEADGAYKVVQVNVDEANELCERYEIFSIPALLVFRGGSSVANRAEGVRPKAAIAAMLK